MHGSLKPFNTPLPESKEVQADGWFSDLLTNNGAYSFVFNRSSRYYVIYTASLLINGNLFVIALYSPTLFRPQPLAPTLTFNRQGINGIILAIRDPNQGTPSLKNSWGLGVNPPESPINP